MKLKKALVTGGAGFIGSHLCEQLIANGYQVTALDNLFAGSLKNLQNISKNKNFRFIKGDVRDEKLIDHEVKRHDIVYHLAAIVGVTVVVNNPLENISVNVEGTKTVAEACLKHKKKIVFTSSSEVYGKNSKVPLKEEASESVFGSTKVSRWAYGLAKALGEHMLFGYQEKGLEFAIVRYFNCFGPRGINPNYANVIPKFIGQALRNEEITVHGKGSGTRCFCYVDDTVRGTILAGDNLRNDVVNIGSNKEISILKLAQTIIKLTKSDSKIIFIPENKVYTRNYESAQRRVPNIAKAQNLLGFKRKVNFENGLKQTVEWTRHQLKK
ncbi:MAG: SDR family NAD(P)-dependent oxidoreductase [Patescibacteria group bacterium]